MARQTVSRSGLVPRALGLAAGIAAAGLVFAFDPASGGFWRCPLHFITGLLCPGCGGQRAAHLLLHGDLPGALRHNALFVLSLPVLLCLSARWLLAPLGVHRSAPARRAAWGWWAGLAAFAFMVLRNVPAFSELAPPG